MLPDSSYRDILLAMISSCVAINRAESILNGTAWWIWICSTYLCKIYCLRHANVYDIISFTTFSDQLFTIRLTILVLKYQIRIIRQYLNLQFQFCFFFLYFKIKYNYNIFQLLLYWPLHIISEAAHAVSLYRIYLRTYILRAFTAKTRG